MLRANDYNLPPQEITYQKWDQIYERMNQTCYRASLLVGGHPFVLQYKVANQVCQKRMHPILSSIYESVISLPCQYLHNLGEDIFGNVRTLSPVGQYQVSPLAYFPSKFFYLFGKPWKEFLGQTKVAII